uniref:Tyrosine specific protein phosphatases domain-containing protein n=1 Tax=Daphnia galeata TaxID=27404 RepID=A0A8J2VZ26_9CRUS|nr:unnamed protein product [Daphnia galeata]
MKNRHLRRRRIEQHAGLQHLICLGHQRHLSGESGIGDQGLMRQTKRVKNVLNPCPCIIFPFFSLQCDDGKGLKQTVLVEQQKVNAVVSLNEDYEVRYLTNQPEEWKKLGVDSIRYSVVDMFEAPPQEILLDGVEFINRTISKGGVVYVHCKAGRSRSAALVCLLLDEETWLDSSTSYITSQICETTHSPSS